MPYKDKQKQKECQKKHYEANKEIYNARRLKSNIKIRDKNRAYVTKYLEDKSCIKCGESNPVCLDFHHREPSEKVKTISRLKSSGMSIKALIKEIEKCDVVCANCHRKIHSNGQI